MLNQPHISEMTFWCFWTTILVYFQNMYAHFSGTFKNEKKIQGRGGWEREDGESESRESQLKRERDLEREIDRNMYSVIMV